MRTRYDHTNVLLRVLFCLFIAVPSYSQVTFSLNYQQAHTTISDEVLSRNHFIGWIQGVHTAIQVQDYHEFSFNWQKGQITNTTALANDLAIIEASYRYRFQFPQLKHWYFGVQMIYYSYEQGTALLPTLALPYFRKQLHVAPVVIYEQGLLTKLRLTTGLSPSFVALNFSEKYNYIYDTSKTRLMSVFLLEQYLQLTFKLSERWELDFTERVNYNHTMNAGFEVMQFAVQFGAKYKIKV